MPANQEMESYVCLHCRVSVHVAVAVGGLGGDRGGKWWNVRWSQCSNCGNLQVQLQSIFKKPNQAVPRTEKRIYQVFPKGVTKTHPSSLVPEPLRTDYIEACTVLEDSPKASAALSRRCLQLLLRDIAKTTQRDLANQIQEVLDRHTLPSHIAESIDAIRAIGNFSAHPIKSTQSGEIVDVEPGEAEWNLDVLESLFDFYIVAPARLRAKREALDKKLAEAGKPPIKQPAPAADS
jgi:hypothetical protein